MKRSSLRRTPMVRRYVDTGPDKATEALLNLRCRWACEICGEKPATQTHHRTPRGLGSTRDPRINSPANLLRLDADCHRYVETHRAEALIAGWLVSRYSDPARVPVLIHNGSRWVNLSADGRYLDPEEVPA
ncbi:MAG TPA: hypothetical protein VFY84_19535 [Jiangellales bacterium]|nr:hypothetical protein [Jiangellales bacterium]